ncbi:endonuclease III [bacterium]|nr:endonuclease III [bacterium]
MAGERQRPAGSRGSQDHSAARIKTAAAQELSRRARRIGKTLARLYPEARISLNFTTPWQCLAATILSAQCTDERVNRVTPALFHEFPDAKATAAADPARIEKLIQTTGFFRQKTKSLIATARALVERFGGEVPNRMEDLVTLPGVGRKTANVILGHVFKRPGFVVDTHVRRLTRRMGLSSNNDVESKPTCRCSCRRIGGRLSMRLILHGRFCRVPAMRRMRSCPRIGVPAPHSNVPRRAK